MTQDKKASFRSGFAALMGAPNVGKSTLLNRFLGEKLSITSSKPQTTRDRILGVVHNPDYQVILLDTPGVHKAIGALNQHMVDVAMNAVAEVDIILFVVDASRPDSESEKMVVKKLKDRKRPTVLAVNKIDLVPGPTLLPILGRWQKTMDFSAIIPVSAKNGDQVNELLAAIAKLLPPGPAYFPEDMITDRPERFIVAEMIREKVFRLTSKEIPYSTAVTIELFKEEENLIRIHAAVHIERDSQKGIIIGKQGAMLKRIGTQARLEIEKMVGKKVYLRIFVRIEKNWSTDTKAMRRLGYE